MKASARVLRLLALLQTRREWSGAALSERLEVDIRTVRRDVDRLRQLGYTVEASAGPGGGYRLGTGATTPPLLLDDEEALAVALALGVATSSVTGLQEIALRVLLKLDQLLPRRLRRRLGPLQRVMVPLAGANAAPEALTRLAGACRDCLRVTFQYQDRRGRGALRETEPLHLVHTGRVWYLVAWDVARDDWRTFRVDRIDPSSLRIGEPFLPKQLPEDAATFVSRSITSAPYRHRIRVEIDEAPDAARKRIPQWVGMVEPSTDGRAAVVVSADTFEAATALLLHVGRDFILIEPPEAADALRALADRLLRATEPAAGSDQSRSQWQV